MPFLTFFAQQPAATVLLEACGSAHHWARQLQQCGHAVRLLPAHDVHRYVRRDKTDRGDAKALLEAARNDETRAVPIKTMDQQMIASLHRVRSTCLATRTARLNTVRGLLREFGIVIPGSIRWPTTRACRRCSGRCSARWPRRSVPSRGRARHRSAARDARPAVAGGGPPADRAGGRRDHRTGGGPPA